MIFWQQFFAGLIAMSLILFGVWLMGGSVYDYLCIYEFGYRGC